MTKREEKEKSICEAVLRLWRGGAQLHCVTVQQIADAAGMGKGTVYEYFASREEILARALAYQVETAFCALEAAVAAAPAFAQKLEALLEAAEWMVQEGAAGVRLLLASLQGADVPAQACRCRDAFAQRLGLLLARLLQEGVEEGAVNPALSERGGLLALSGVLMAYVKQRQDEPELLPAVLREEVLAILDKVFR